MYVSRNEKREGKSQKRVNKSYLIFTVQELLMIPRGNFRFFSEKLPINIRNGILLPKLFWPTVIKNCSSHREKLLKFEAEGQEFSKNFRSLEQFNQTVKGQNNFW